MLTFSKTVIYLNLKKYFKFSRYNHDQNFICEFSCHVSWLQVASIRPGGFKMSTYRYQGFVVYFLSPGTALSTNHDFVTVGTDSSINRKLDS